VKHSASPKFWMAYHALPLSIRTLADSNVALLKRDPRHPSLRAEISDFNGAESNALQKFG